MSDRRAAGATNDCASGVGGRPKTASVNAASLRSAAADAAPEDAGAFEHFLSSALATILTIIFSWSFLVDELNVSSSAPADGQLAIAATPAATKPPLPRKPQLGGSTSSGNSTATTAAADSDMSAELANELDRPESQPPVTDSGTLKTQIFEASEPRELDVACRRTYGAFDRGYVIAETLDGSSSESEYCLVFRSGLEAITEEDTDALSTSSIASSRSKLREHNSLPRNGKSVARQGPEAGGVPSRRPIRSPDDAPSIATVSDDVSDVSSLDNEMIIRSDVEFLAEKQAREVLSADGGNDHLRSHDAQMDVTVETTTVVAQQNMSSRPLFVGDNHAPFESNRFIRGPLACATYTHENGADYEGDVIRSRNASPARTLDTSDMTMLDENDKNTTSVYAKNRSQVDERLASFASSWDSLQRRRENGSSDLQREQSDAHSDQRARGSGNGLGGMALPSEDPDSSSVVLSGSRESLLLDEAAAIFENRAVASDAANSTIAEKLGGGKLADEKLDEWQRSVELEFERMRSSLSARQHHATKNSRDRSPVDERLVELDAQARELSFLVSAADGGWEDRPIDAQHSRSVDGDPLPPHTTLLRDGQDDDARRSVTEDSLASGASHDVPLSLSQENLAEHDRQLQLHRFVDTEFLDRSFVDGRSLVENGVDGQLDLCNHGKHLQDESSSVSSEIQHVLRTTTRTYVDPSLLSHSYTFEKPASSNREDVLRPKTPVDTPKLRVLSPSSGDGRSSLRCPSPAAEGRESGAYSPASHQRPSIVSAAAEPSGSLRHNQFSAPPYNPYDRSRSRTVASDGVARDVRRSAEREKRGSFVLHESKDNGVPVTWARIANNTATTKQGLTTDASCRAMATSTATARRDLHASRPGQATLDELERTTSTAVASAEASGENPYIAVARATARAATIASASAAADNTSAEHDAKDISVMISTSCHIQQADEATARFESDDVVKALERDSETCSRTIGGRKMRITVEEGERKQHVECNVPSDGHDLNEAVTNAVKKILSSRQGCCLHAALDAAIERVTHQVLASYGCSSGVRDEAGGAEPQVRPSLSSFGIDLHPSARPVIAPTTAQYLLRSSAVCPNNGCPSRVTPPHTLPVSSTFPSYDATPPNRRDITPTRRLPTRPGNVSRLTDVTKERQKSPSGRTPLSPGPSFGDAEDDDGPFVFVAEKNETDEDVAHDFQRDYVVSPETPDTDFSTTSSVPQRPLRGILKSRGDDSDDALSTPEILPPIVRPPRPKKPYESVLLQPVPSDRKPPSTPFDSAQAPISMPKWNAAQVPFEREWEERKKKWSEKQKPNLSATEFDFPKWTKKQHVCEARYVLEHAKPPPPPRSNVESTWKETIMNSSLSHEKLRDLDDNYPTSGISTPSEYEVRRVRSLGSVLPGQFFGDKRSFGSLLETDLDSGHHRATPLFPETNIDSAYKARSLTNLREETEWGKICHIYSDADERGRSVDALDEMGPFKETFGRSKSESEIRIAKSLNKLSVPTWVRNTPQHDVVDLPNTRTPAKNRTAHLRDVDEGFDLSKSYGFRAAPMSLPHRVAPNLTPSPSASPQEEFFLPSERFRNSPSSLHPIVTRLPDKPSLPPKPIISAKDTYLRMKSQNSDWSSKGEGHGLSRVQRRTSQKSRDERATAAIDGSNGGDTRAFSRNSYNSDYPQKFDPTVDHEESGFSESSRYRDWRPDSSGSEQLSPLSVTSRESLFVRDVTESPESGLGGISGHTTAELVESLQRGNMQPLVATRSQTYERKERRIIKSVFRKEEDQVPVESSTWEDVSVKKTQETNEPLHTDSADSGISLKGTPLHVTHHSSESQSTRQFENSAVGSEQLVMDARRRGDHVVMEADWKRMDVSPRFKRRGRAAPRSRRKKMHDASLDDVIVGLLGISDGNTDEVGPEVEDDDQKDEYYDSQESLLEESAAAQTLRLLESPTRLRAQDSPQFQRRPLIDCELETLAPVTCHRVGCGETAELREARQHFRSCPDCYTLYCSRTCRRKSSDVHVCSLSRLHEAGDLALRHLHEDIDLLQQLSQLAGAGHDEKGRGCCLLVFADSKSVTEFLESDKLSHAWSYVSLDELESAAHVMGEHLTELRSACLGYRPDTQLVADVAILSESRTGRVVKCCAVLRRREAIVQRHASDLETTLICMMPGAEHRENIEAKRAREIRLASAVGKLKLGGVALREHFPDAYQALSRYVENGQLFTPMTLYPFNTQTRRKFSCIILPQAKPNVEWTHSTDVLAELGLSTSV